MIGLQKGESDITGNHGNIHINKCGNTALRQLTKCNRTFKSFLFIVMVIC